MGTLLRAYTVNKASVAVYSSTSEMGKAAASDAAQVMRDAISRQGYVRIIVATGNSQLDVIKALTTEETIDWKSVQVFHMDEYVGMASTHPASFAHWLENFVTKVVHPGKVFYLRGDSPDLEQAFQRYGELLMAKPIDLCFLGFGENGHIAFNDPHVANFIDPLILRRVTLDSKCRNQQVGEGHFPNLQSVPLEAITLTCPALMSARNLICCVPEHRKAEAVRAALEGPLTEQCPASLVVTHPQVKIYLDPESAALLSPAPVLRP
jgi:glucosamine-6-phosphate deaminase